MRYPLFGIVFVALAAFQGFAQDVQKPLRGVAKLDPKIFDSQPATMAPDIFGDRQKNTGVLRILTVDERMGYARKNELVRVPVFFHEGECADPNGLQIVPATGGAPVPYQAYDIRRDAAGKVARMHLYFFLTELPAWGRKQFQLMSGNNPGATLPALPITEADGKVTLGGEDLKLTFQTKGDFEGAIAAIENSAGKVAIPEGHLAPSPEIIRQRSSGGETFHDNLFRYAEPNSVIVKNVAWASGPLFAKVVVRLAPRNAPADLAEYAYLIPKFGSEFTQMQRLFPEGADTREVVGAKANTLLVGKIILGDSEADQQVLSIPAGLRRDQRAVYKYDNKALVNAKAGMSLTMVPYVQMGAREMGVDENGRTFFNGASNFQTQNGSNSHGLRSWWGQVRFVFSRNTDPEALWQQNCKNFQPLTAVVDEPWATPDDIWNFAQQINKEYWKIQNWGRSSEANLVMNFLDGKDVSKALEPAASSDPKARPDLRSFIATKEMAEDAWKKGQGAAPVDPYGITYSLSAIVPFSAFIQPSPKLDAMAWQYGQASRFVNEKNTPEGFPNIRTFANTPNMKVGTYLCALWGGMKLGDADLARWGRDAATVQTFTGVYGRAQRPYNGTIGVTMDQSDVLYISVTDYWLRAMELIGNEDLSIHPAAYGRYFDSIDVNADIYQRKFEQDKTTKEFATTSVPTWWRATFLRSQTHDHRWELFGCDPFLGLLGKASDGGKVGVTETCYYLQREVGKTQSWQYLMTNVFFPAVMSTKGLANYHPAPRPALPTEMKVSETGGKNVVTWSAVPGAAGYRVYRASQVGGPWTWVNSPYAKMPTFQLPTNADKAAATAAAATADAEKAKSTGVDIKKLKMTDKTSPASQMPKVEIPAIPDTLVKGTSFTDPDGAAGSVYFVTAQDAAGRESRWFPNEPVPVPSK